jgi:hypothetical protein
MRWDTAPLVDSDASEDTDELADGSLTCSTRMPNADGAGESA